eukprot:2888355-Rhodomonas_salina.1
MQAGVMRQDLRVHKENIAEREERGEPRAELGIDGRAPLGDLEGAGSPARRNEERVNFAGVHCSGLGSHTRLPRSYDRGATPRSPVVRLRSRTENSFLATVLAQGLCS